MDDVFGEILKFEQFFALLIEFDAFSAERLSQKAGQVGDSQETEQVAEKPDPQPFRTRHEQEGPRYFARKGERGHAAEDQKTYRGGDKRHLPRKQNAGHNDDEQVEGNERALLKARGIDQRRNDDDVARNLEGTLPSSASCPANQRNMHHSQEDPGKQQRQEGTICAGGGNILWPDQIRR